MLWPALIARWHRRYAQVRLITELVVWKGLFVLGVLQCVAVCLNGLWRSVGWCYAIVSVRLTRKCWVRCGLWLVLFGVLVFPAVFAVSEMVVHLGVVLSSVERRIAG